MNMVILHFLQFHTGYAMEAFSRKATQLVIFIREDFKTIFLSSFQLYWLDLKFKTSKQLQTPCVFQNIRSYIRDFENLLVKPNPLHVFNLWTSLWKLQIRSQEVLFRLAVCSLIDSLKWLSKHKPSTPPTRKQKPLQKQPRWTSQKRLSSTKPPITTHKFNR